MINNCSHENSVKTFFSISRAIAKVGVYAVNRSLCTCTALFPSPRVRYDLSLRYLAPEVCAGKAALGTRVFDFTRIALFRSR